MSDSLFVVRSLNVPLQISHISNVSQNKSSSSKSSKLVFVDFKFVSSMYL